MPKVMKRPAGCSVKRRPAGCSMKRPASNGQRLSRSYEDIRKRQYAKARASKKAASNTQYVPRAEYLRRCVRFSKDISETRELANGAFDVSIAARNDAAEAKHLALEANRMSAAALACSNATNTNSDTSATHTSLAEDHEHDSKYDSFYFPDNRKSTASY